MKALMAAPLDPANLPEAELERIFREHHAMVFRAAYRVTGNADDAEDVLQTVFLRMVKRDAGAEPVENMASFLHRAAVNAALDLVRSRQNIRNVPLDESGTGALRAGPSQPRSHPAFRRNSRVAARRVGPPQSENRGNVYAALFRWQR